MSTVLVDHYEAKCKRCGWLHCVMVGGDTGSYLAHVLAVARHANAMFGRCGAYPDEITVARAGEQS